MAHAAVQDGLPHVEIMQMASLGAWGTVSGNVNRDLKKLAKDNYLPKPFTVRCPCLDPKSSVDLLTWEDVSMFLPHEVCAFLSGLGDEYSRLLGTDYINKFWSAVQADDPRLAYAAEPSLDG